MIKLRILRCVKIKKNVFFLYQEREREEKIRQEKKWERGRKDENNRVTYRSKKLFSFYPSTSKAAARGYEKNGGREREKNTKGSRCWSIKRERRFLHCDRTQSAVSPPLSPSLPPKSNDSREHDYIYSLIFNINTLHLSSKKKLLMLSIMN